MNTLGLLALLATAPDGGSSPASTSTFVYTVMFCDASTCGDDVLQRRGVEKLNPNLGTTPFAVESGTEPELVTEKTPIHVKVNQARFVRFPCAPNRIAFNDYPWAFTPTDTRGEGFVRGLCVGRAPMIIWCEKTTRSFHVVVEP